LKRELEPGIIWQAIEIGCFKGVKRALSKGAKQGLLANNENTSDGDTPLCKAAEKG